MHPIKKIFKRKINLTLSAFFLMIFLLSIGQTATAQKEMRTFIFGHSLINHEFQVNPTPSQETSVPHWLHFLAKAAGNSYAVSGQYGFLPQHSNLPPIAQWGFDVVEGAWESDTQPFSDADFTNILITPGNFIQWQGPDINYPNENTSPVKATVDIINWCLEQEGNLDFYIYENWPDMSPFLASDFPPSGEEWLAYNEYLNGDFHTWFINYYNLVKDQFPDICVRMIPVGPIISNVLLREPFNNIPILDLYEDDAPHGRPSIYFLASMITYMATYEEKTPENFVVDEIIHPIIRNNYNTLVDIIWNELLEFLSEEGNNLAFCRAVNTHTDDRLMHNTDVYPNPANEVLYISQLPEGLTLDIVNQYGQIVMTQKSVNHLLKIDIRSLPPGYYLLVGHSKDYNLATTSFIKIR